MSAHGGDRLRTRDLERTLQKKFLRTVKRATFGCERFSSFDSAIENSNRSFVEISKDNDIGYFLPDMTNLDKSAHTCVDRSDLRLACDVEGTVV